MYFSNPRFNPEPIVTLNPDLYPNSYCNPYSIPSVRPVAGSSAVAATAVASKLNVAAKEWVPPSAATAAAPAANGSGVHGSQQQQNNWQYGGWAADGTYDASAYEYGYDGWQASGAAAAQWGHSGG